MYKLSEELNTNIPTLSLAYAMAKEGINCTFVGSRNVNELKMNIASASYVLTEDALRRLNKSSEAVLKKMGTNPDYYENIKNGRIF